MCFDYSDVFDRIYNRSSFHNLSFPQQLGCEMSEFWKYLFAWWLIRKEERESKKLCKLLSKSFEEMVKDVK